MFAVIKTGGKQYKVATDDVITIERLQGEAGDVITFDEVLLIGGETTVVGAPVISGASVSATLVEQSRAKKVIIFKKRRRKSWRKKEGHRQDQSVVKITAINA
ncbi:50S ribosomal protein L21 [Siculibacillus lacustris]|uniref:Large ribosomal subunit protein bL21 n=1 Tax=Siculibacillus lacustris TaxID=1549641 RepID=A0A4Q9VUU7_9HYPH|nr:50S ribosomal protein L21 [Siculibacillus lacustris]TBW39978.1 50S ribosomal protein L21 [Siculibacillus lacustris]